MATIPHTCAVCGTSKKTLKYSDLHKFFWCHPCKLKSLKSKTKFLTLTAQQTTTDDYHVYALLDPRDQKVYYIGMSRRPEVRLIEHTSQKAYKLRYAWIKALEQQGLRPLLKIIETAGKDRAYAFKREKYWIRYFLSQNAPLLNLSTTRRPKAS